ncbi:hypothetical protein SAY86_020351 [Trapa natans]|uniref:Uncharacterized protein n=1 Tax=Trapa natans TaxID=22666 RepID=A0AAN7R442_TRANT|nr:hypothetical protein SAY86_020351 [Trapa natans]
MDNSTHHFHQLLASNAEYVEGHVLKAAADFFNMADQQLEPGFFERVLRILTTDNRDPVRCSMMVSKVLKDFPGLRSQCRRSWRGREGGPKRRC